MSTWTVSRITRPSPPADDGLEQHRLALMPRLAGRATLIVMVAAVWLGVSSCGDGGEPLIVVSSTDVRVLSPNEVRNNVYLNYVIGVHDLKPANLRQASCSFYATDADIETMLGKLSEFERVERVQFLRADS